MAYNVLIVDDSAIVRSVVARILGMCGVELGEILQAENGKIALQKLEDNWVDIMFLDINMPVMNGIELIEQMEKSGTLQSTPVVIVSTERSETRIKNLLDKGVVAYLNKPFTPEKIRDVVVDMLGGNNP